MDNRYIVGIGEALWDMLPAGKEIGGAPANFAYHVSQFGLNSKVISAIGSDELGVELLDNFDKNGLQYIVESVQFETGVVGVELDANGVPVYEIKENVAWDNIPYTQEIAEIAKNTSVVCFGSLAQRNDVSRNTIHKFLEDMPETENTYKIFDINLRQSFYTKEVLIESLNKCNILKINDEELVLLNQMFNYSEDDMDSVCKVLMGKFNLIMLVLTCGATGSYVYSNNDVSYVATPTVNVADTVGAGDSFTAAFISSILCGESMRDAHARAVAVSAFVCGQKGAMPTLPKELLSI